MRNLGKPYHVTRSDDNRTFQKDIVRGHSEAFQNTLDCSSEGVLS